VSTRSIRDHIAEEDFVLDYYGELDAEERARVRGHLAWCGACQLADQDVRATLRLVDVAPPPEPPPSFEREMWARIEPHLAEATPRPSWFDRMMTVLRADGRYRMRVAWGAGVAAAVVAAFVVGRSARIDGPEPGMTRPAALAVEARERVLDAEVEDHFERSQRVLSYLVNAEGTSTVVLASDRARAADLVAAGRVYRRSADALGEAATSELLEDLERVLLDVANSTPDPAPDELREVRARIDEQDLVFRLRAVGAELQRRQRSALPSF
jgi:hypothetical protein